MDSDLRGKTVLVTGAASGIGEGIARGLARPRTWWASWNCC